MFSKIKILSILLILVSVKFYAFKQQQSFSQEDFNNINIIFKKRFERFQQKNIKIKKTFRDTLFTMQHWALENGDKNKKLTADFQVFFAYNQLIDNDKIISSAMKLLANKDFLEFPESVFVAKELMSAYDRKDFYRKLLELYPLYKKLSIKHKDYKNDSFSEGYYTLAMVYYKLENYDKARENFQSHIKELLNKNKKFKVGSMYNNIGLTYEKQNKFIEAIDYYKKSLKLIDEDLERDDDYSNQQKKHFRNVVASNIASIKVKQQKLEGVESVFLEELASGKKVNRPKITIQSYLNLSELYFLEKKFEKTNQFLDSSFLILKSYENPSLLSRAYQQKGKYLLSIKEIKKAEYYFLKNSILQDSLKKDKIEKNFKEASLQFNLDVVKEDLENSKKFIDQQEKTTKYQWITIGITSIAGIIFFLLFVKIKKDNRYIEKTKKELSKALKNNQTLLQEIHHRIKNNLQIISGILELKSTKLKDKNSVEVFVETQKYIESMSYIHEHLYAQNDKAVINMDAYLKNLTNAIISNYSAKKITVSINIKNVVMNTENATPLGLIVCELITNSAKHAFEESGKIQINLTKENNIFQFHYKDNGKGFILDKKSTSSQIGVNLMNMLIEELQADKKHFINNGYNIKLTFNEIL